MTPIKKCPHCARRLPGKLVWKSLFAGQTAHACPNCRKKFRLTYASKIRVAYLNVVLILGFIILWNLPNIPRNLLAYAALAAAILLVLPALARYEKTDRPYR